MGHILEHVALELQTLAGTPVGYGRTRESYEEGVYKVVIEYEHEELGRAALEAGLRSAWLPSTTSRSTWLRKSTSCVNFARACLPNPTTAALLKAAATLRIPVRHLNAGGLLGLGYGKNSAPLLFTQPDRTSAAADIIAHDRELTLSLLRHAGCPCRQARPLPPLNPPGVPPRRSACPSLFIRSPAAICKRDTAT